MRHTATREPGSSTEAEFNEVEAAGLLAGVETVVLLPPPTPPAGAAEGGGPWLDQATRGTYDVLRAAVCAGAKKVVCLSTMQLLEPYAAELLVDVQYQPLPSTAPGSLGARAALLVPRHHGPENALAQTLTHVWSGALPCHRKPPAGVHLPRVRAARVAPHRHRTAW